MSANLAKHVGQRIPLIKFTHGFNKCKNILNEW
jgi:hypothetical protein